MNSSPNGSAPNAGWNGWYITSLITTDWLKTEGNDSASHAQTRNRKQCLINLTDYTTRFRSLSSSRENLPGLHLPYLVVTGGRCVRNPSRRDTAPANPARGTPPWPTLASTERHRI